MNITLPTKHQWAVIASHAVVGAGGIVAGVAFFGGLNPAQVHEATQDISRISADVADLIGALSSLGALAMAAYTVLKAGPLASFLRSSVEVASDPAKMAQVQVAPLKEKAAVVAITDKLPEVAGVATIDTRGGQALATAVPSNTVQVAAKVASALLVAFALSMFLPVGSASAQTHRSAPRPLAITGDPIADIKTDLKNAGLVPAAGVTKNSDGTVSCNFNIFANLNPKNLIATVQACVSATNSTFEPDVAAALASAQAYAGSGDQTGIQCLQPALAIVQAGIERPAVEAVPAQPATATTPAVPAVAAVPAYKPGAITLFQKFREFVLAGGPTACQNWVNGTISGAAAPVGAAVAGAAGAAVVGAGL